MFGWTVGKEGRWSMARSVVMEVMEVIVEMSIDASGILVRMTRRHDS